MIETILITSCIFSGWSFFLIIWNSFLFKQPTLTGSSSREAVSILVPARNEQDNIANLIESVLANQNITFELFVLDDHSIDATAEIVKHYQELDPRIILKHAPALPPDWVGKEHACHILSQYANHPLLLFVDADVSFSEDAIGRLINELNSQQVHMLSGFPRQITVSLAEKIVIPMIDFILLGYLPLIGLIKTHFPAFSAANGQLILVRKDSYFEVGGHQANAMKMHDGLALAHNFKKNKLAINICNANKIASCRMYHNFNEVWHGFIKNATEGMATKYGLPIWTILLVLGHLITFLLFPLILNINTNLIPLASMAIGISLIQRIIVLFILGQPLYLVFFHPFSIVVLLAIQWRAFVRATKKIPNEWRGRKYQAKL